MKRFSAIIVGASLLAGTGLVSPPTVHAHDEWGVGISITQTSNFYEPLAPYGYWVDVAPYGRC